MAGASRPGYLLRRGEAESADYLVEVTADRPNWHYGSLRVLELLPGGSHTVATGDEEMLVLPLAGGCRVQCEELDVRVQGRSDVFSRVTDFVYLPPRAIARVSSDAGGRFALPGARAERQFGARYGPSDEVPVEVRGAGAASRQVNNFCSPEGFETVRLMAVEVLTPAGNWSSYPPHKHDCEQDHEASLEEIYYFEVESPGGDREGGYQRVYSSGTDREIDVLEEVHTGDVVLVPFGYHGPTISPPGSALYFLNVLDGPGERRRMDCVDDPSLAWVRSSWSAQARDARLPMTSDQGRR